jgi:hypothetical protein
MYPPEAETSMIVSVPLAYVASWLHGPTPTMLVV